MSRPVDNEPRASDAFGRGPGAPHPFHTAVAGAIAGSGAIVVTAPLDVVRVRMQSSFSSGRFSTEILRTVRGGLSSMFCGVSTNLLGIIPSRAVYFTSYSQYRTALEDHCQVRASMVPGLSGLLAAITTNVITNPIWTVKTVQQLEPVSGPNGVARTPSIRDTFAHIYKTRGFRGYYRGFSAGLIGLGETASYWCLYDYFKRTQAGAEGIGLDATQSAVNSQDYMVFFFGVVGSSGLAKAIATTIWYPHEVLRTRMREGLVSHRASARREGLAEMTKSLVKSGPRVAWGGLIPHLARQVPSAMATFLIYESIMRFLSKRAEQKSSSCSLR